MKRLLSHKTQFFCKNVCLDFIILQELLPAANLTQLIGLKQACCIYLMRQIDPSNVLGIRRFAEIHDCLLLEKFTRKYAAHNMELVLQQSEEFVQLSRSELRQLIKMTDLNVSLRRYGYVWENIYKWVFVQCRVLVFTKLVRNFITI